MQCVVASSQHSNLLKKRQTGKELLLPELPLKIRLIGLRVTKLKDLRASSSEIRGIKRVSSFRLYVCIMS
jgi:hypothetical protein